MGVHYVQYTIEQFKWPARFFSDCLNFTMTQFRNTSSLVKISYFTDIKFFSKLYLNYGSSMIETSSGLPRKSPGIIGNLHGKSSAMFKLFGNVRVTVGLRTSFGEFRKSQKNRRKSIKCRPNTTYKKIRLDNVVSPYDRHKQPAQQTFIWKRTEGKETVSECKQQRKREGALVCSLDLPVWKID